MKEDWDFYATQIEHNTVTIFVNLDVANWGPDPLRTRLVRVSVDFKFKATGGMTDPDETPKLYQLEDQLYKVVSADNGGQYVGRITFEDRREFFYYTRPIANLADTISAAVEKVDIERLQIDESDDRDWSLYFDKLYPSELDFQSIQNRRVVRTLEEAGDNGEQPRPITHLSFFPTEGARSNYIEEIKNEGFQVDLTEDREPDAEYRFGVSLTRNDPATMNFIDGLAIDLYLRTSTHGGEYDGWECDVLT